MNDSLIGLHCIGLRSAGRMKKPLRWIANCIAYQHFWKMTGADCMGGSLVALLCQGPGVYCPRLDSKSHVHFFSEKGMNSVGVIGWRD